MREVSPAPEPVKRAVMQRICEEASVPAWKAGEWFDEMLKFLSLTDAGSDLHPVPSRPVDVAWHNFILLTRPYADYCQSTFGRFMHHDVDLEASVADEHGGHQLDYYRQTRQVIRREFGAIDPGIWPDAIDWDEQKRRFQERGTCDMGDVVHQRFYEDADAAPRGALTEKMRNFGASEPVLVAGRRLLDRTLIPVSVTPLGQPNSTTELADSDLSVVANLSDQAATVRLSSGPDTETIALTAGAAIGFDAYRVQVLEPAAAPRTLVLISYGGF
jgi:hypothetical protein